MGTNEYIRERLYRLLSLAISSCKDDMCFVISQILDNLNECLIIPSNEYRVEITKQENKTFYTNQTYETYIGKVAICGKYLNIDAELSPTEEGREIIKNALEGELLDAYKFRK